MPWAGTHIHCGDGPSRALAAKSPPPRSRPPRRPMTRSSPPQRRPGTRSACSRLWRTGDGNRLTVHDSTQWPTQARTTLATLFSVPEQNVRALIPYLGGGVRGGTSYLAAHGFDRAGGADGEPPGQASADPAGDVHRHRPSPADGAAPAARCHPGRRAAGHRPRSHLNPGDLRAHLRTDQVADTLHVRL